MKCIGGTSGWPPWTGGRHMEVAAKAGLTVYLKERCFAFLMYYILKLNCIQEFRQFLVLSHIKFVYIINFAYKVANM